MFVGQQVFCRTDSAFKFDFIAEINNDSVRLVNGSRVLHESIIPSISTKSCELSHHKTDTITTLVHPGVLLHYEKNHIKIIKPNEIEIASFESVPYDSYAVDLTRKKLFAYDKAKNEIIIMPFPTGFPTGSPTKHDLAFEADWFLINRTPFVVFWSSSRCSVLNTENNTILPLVKHRERITAIQSTFTGDVCLIGDRTGHVSIWYTSNWDRHHYIRTSHTSINEIDINIEKKACICSTTTIAVIDILSAVVLFSRDIVLQHVCIMDNIIIGSDENRLMVFSAEDGSGINTLKLKDAITSISGSIKRRCWVYTHKYRKELRFSDTVLYWPQECFEWIQAPYLPLEVENKWQNNIGYDILIQSTDIWMRRLSSYTFPNQWLRYIPLCTAIWSELFCLELDLVDFDSIHNQFISSSSRSKWVEACKNFIYEKTSASFEWNTNIICILEKIAKPELDFPSLKD